MTWSCVLHPRVTKMWHMLLVLHIYVYVHCNDIVSCTFVYFRVTVLWVLSRNGFTLSGLHVAWEERVQLCAIHGIAPHTRRCEFLSALSWGYQLSLYITRSCFCNSTHDTLGPVGHTCCKFFPPVERVSSKRVHQGHVCHLFLILSVWLVIAPAIWKIFSFV